jgi:hypothetical protein
MFSRDTDVQFLRNANIINGAFPICRWLTNSSNSLVDRSANLIAKDRGEYRQAAGVGSRIQAAAKLSCEASSWDILALVSGARRRWYAVMHAEEQKCMCQY